MTTAAFVPAKAFGRAKSRLSAVLGEAERARLARACFSRVIEALSASGRFEAIFVGTDGDEVESLARALGCDVLRDPSPPRAFSEIVDAALDAIAARGFDRALVVMADLPEASAGSFELIFDAGGDVVLVPDAEGLGTSALLVPLPRRFDTAFGHHDSGARNERAARGAGCAVTRAHVPTLARDVDGPLDLVGRDALYVEGPRET